MTDSTREISTALRPIETRYRGYRFRSRLEARWAVFFDAAGISWQYEPEGFELPGIGRYLPDFFLTQTSEWLEIKPSRPTGKELEKAWAFHRGLRSAAIMILAGQPWRSPHGGRPEYTVWRGGMEAIYEDSDVQFLECVGCAQVAAVEMLWGTQYYCEHCDMVVRPPANHLGDHGWLWHKGDWSRDSVSVGEDPRFSKRVMSAYTAARSARFEHGESPDARHG